VKIVAILRIPFIALAIVLGFGLTTAGVLGLWEFGLASAGGAAGIDGLAPFRFSTYAFTPVFGALVLVSGFAALRRSWHALFLVSWILIGAALVGALDAVWNLAPGEMFPALGNLAMVLLPVVGLVLASAAKANGKHPASIPASASLEERIRLRNTLIALVVISYLWRAVALALSPGAISALAYLLDSTEASLILSSLIALVISLALLLAAVMPSIGAERFMPAALAFTAGLTFEGLLHALDFTTTGGSAIELTYALQDGVAFVASAAALALSPRAVATAQPFEPGEPQRDRPDAKFH
jgi:hypothetical protein